MKHWATGGAILMLCLGLVLPIGAAETSQTIAFSGCDPNLTGPVDVRLRLFTASAGGMLVFEETQMGVDGSSGCLSVQVGNATPRNLVSGTCLAPCVSYQRAGYRTASGSDRVLWFAQHRSCWPTARVDEVRPSLS